MIAFANVDEIIEPIAELYSLVGLAVQAEQGSLGEISFGRLAIGIGLRHRHLAQRDTP